MNYSWGLFCHHTRSRPQTRSEREDQCVLLTTTLLCETDVKDIWEWGNWDSRSEQGQCQIERL